MYIHSIKFNHIKFSISCCRRSNDDDEPCPFTEKERIAMAIDILHNAILGRTKDLPKGFFSETSARSSFLEKFKTFHSEGAVKSRAVSVAHRQKEEKKLRPI